MADHVVSVPRPDLHHRVRRMAGRDPHEVHRAATPLELLFDLTFVVAFSQAANELSHYLAEGHIRTAIVGFCFAMFAVCWAWINFSWFASAFDTDDWIYRTATMVQMIGVIILALGLPTMFASIDAGELVDNRVMVGGYIVMRVAMVFQWLRAARQDPIRRPACLTFAVTISMAQVGWIVVLLAETSVLVMFLWVVVLVAVELLGPIIAERKVRTPWHAHHIAERYGLLAIIALGEAIIGTVAALSVVIEQTGWTFDATVLGLAGIGLTWGLWWIYFIVPSAEILHAHRERAFLWGYGHIVVFAGIAAVGAGLHVAAYYLEGVSHLDATATILAIAVPLGIVIVGIYALYSYLVRDFDPFHLFLLAGTIAVLVVAVVLAAAGARMTVCLLVLGLAPLVTIVGYELRGHRHLAAVLERATR